MMLFSTLFVSSICLFSDNGLSMTKIKSVWGKAVGNVKPDTGLIVLARKNLLKHFDLEDQNTRETTRELVKFGSMSGVKERKIGYVTRGYLAVA